MVKVSALLLCACVVLSGCTTTVRNRSSIATTNTSPTGLGPSTNGSSSHPTNYYAPPRLALQSLKGTNRTPTVEVPHHKEPYNGIPRLAGTVAQNSARSSSNAAIIGEPVTGGDSSAPETLGQTAQAPVQPADALAQVTPDPFEAGDVSILHDSNFLRAFGLLVVMAFGIWGIVRFFDSEKSVNHSFTSNGNGADSQKSRSEGHIESRPKQGRFESDKRYYNRLYLEGKGPITDAANGENGNTNGNGHGILHEANGAIAEKANGSGPKPEFSERDGKHHEQVANEPNEVIIDGLRVSIPSQRFFEGDEKRPDRIGKKENGDIIEEVTDSPHEPRFLESDEVFKARSKQETKDIKDSGQG